MEKCIRGVPECFCRSFLTAINNRIRDFLSHSDRSHHEGNHEVMARVFPPFLFFYFFFSPIEQKNITENRCIYLPHVSRHFYNFWQPTEMFSIVFVRNGCLLCFLNCNVNARKATFQHTLNFVVAKRFSQELVMTKFIYISIYLPFINVFKCVS